MSWERGQAEGSLSSLHRGMLGPRHVSQSGRHPAIMILLRKLRIKKSERAAKMHPHSMLINFFFVDRTPFGAGHDTVEKGT